MIESGEAYALSFRLQALLRRCMVGSGVGRSFRPKPHSPDESQRVSLGKATSISGMRVEAISKFEKLTRTTAGKEEETPPLTRPRICSFCTPITC
jgi:hypothetical protein